MVKEIEINIRNGLNDNIKALIYVKELKIFLNGKIYSIKQELIDNILDILCLWDYEYGKREGIDLEEFNIKVYSTDGVTNYHGLGVFPYNYGELLNLLGGINE